MCFGRNRLASDPLGGTCLCEHVACFKRAYCCFGPRPTDRELLTYDRSRAEVDEITRSMHPPIFGTPAPKRSPRSPRYAVPRSMQPTALEAKMTALLAKKAGLDGQVAEACNHQAPPPDTPSPKLAATGSSPSIGSPPSRSPAEKLRHLSLKQHKLRQGAETQRSGSPSRRSHRATSPPIAALTDRPLHTPNQPTR